MAEHRQKEKEREASDLLLLETLKARDMRLMQLEGIEDECKKQLVLSTAAMNEALVKITFIQ